MSGLTAGSWLRSVTIAPHTAWRAASAGLGADVAPAGAVADRGAGVVGGFVATVAAGRVRSPGVRRRRVDRIRRRCRLRWARGLRSGSWGRSDPLGGHCRRRRNDGCDPRRDGGDRAGRGSVVEQRKVELEPETTRTEPRRVDGREAAPDRDEPTRFDGPAGGPGQTGHERGAKGFEDLVEEGPRIAAAVLEVVEDGHPGRGIAGRERGQEPGHGIRVGEAEQVAHGVGGEALAAAGEQLVEHRLRVAHAAGGEPGDEIDGLRVGARGLSRPGCGVSFPRSARW